MPWHIAERDGQFCVVKDGETVPIPGGCHPTQAEAQSHLRALYAAEPAAQGAVAEPCACGNTSDAIRPEFIDLREPERTLFSRALNAREARSAAAMEPLDSPFPVPAYPPSEWYYERPDWLTPETKIGVDEAGRVAGYFYNAGQCLLYRPDACPKPSPTFYAAFHQQEVMATAPDGESHAILCGVIGNTHGHANPFAPVDTAQRHYQDPSAQLVSCRAYDDEHGGYILGSVVPHASYGDVALIRRSALSGDWRHMPQQWWDGHGIQASVVRACEGFDCIGPTLVTRPGLPVIRRYGNSRAAAVLGGVGGIQLDDEEFDMTDTNGGAPIVVHQHFHDAAPGPQPARTAADGPPGAPPAADQAPSGEAPTREEFDALVAIVQDMSGRLDACEQAIGAAADTQMAAMEAAVEPLPEPVSV